MKLTKKELNHFMNQSMHPFLQKYGFGHWRSSSQSGGWLRITEEAFFSIGYGFLTYETYKISPILNYNIMYPCLEDILTPVLEKNRVISTGINRRDLISYGPILTYYEPSYHDFDDRITIRETVDLMPVLENYQRMFVTEILPFFEQFRDLNQFYLFLKQEMEKPETGPFHLHNLLYSMNPTSKLLIIYRLCNDNRYKSLMESEYQVLEQAYQAVPEHMDIQKRWGVIQDLRTVLEQTEPIFNI
jgi:hypothetical protein